AARQAYAPPPAEQPTYPQTPAAAPAYGGAAQGYGSAAPSYPSSSTSGSGSSRAAPLIAFATLLIGGVLIYGFLSGKVGGGGSATPTPTAAVVAATKVATATPAGAPTPGLGLLGLVTPTATRAATATVAPPTPSPTTPPTVATGRNPGVDRALKGAVVQVIIPIPNTQEAALGSGSLLTRSGYILTNAHVVLDDAKRNLLNNGEGIVAIPPTEGGVAKPRYRAKVVDVLRDQDLALLKISGELDRSPLRGPLSIEPLDVGSSETVRIDDPLVIVGYPGLGGDSITVTRGIVSGIDQQRGFWKTDSEVSPGNSGGAALNQKGELIGVPTAGIVSQETVSKISLVRPIQSAKPLIDKARADP
ncbi:MAG: trypsin-like peptidase domain-containing protein, partial [Chloroflexi bacterium]|nr:trypsin-like peptidase domain-containing protein [Chloroflexota bacterium]